MVSHHHGNILPLEPLAAHLGDAFLAAGERARGGAAQRADGLRTDRDKLAVEELAADLHLVRLGRAVPGRTALHHIADVDVGARERDAFLLGGALDHLREQLSGAPDERDALRVFIGAGAFADEHQRGLLVADAEDDLVAALVQAAAVAIADVLEDLEKGFAGWGEWRQRRRSSAVQVGQRGRGCTAAGTLR